MAFFFREWESDCFGGPRDVNDFCGSWFTEQF